MTERKETIEKHGIIFVIFDGLKVQLEKRTRKKDLFYGYTVIPGGKVERGEAPQNALIREIWEEYGITGVEADEIGVIESVENSGQLNFRHVFLVNKWKGRLKNPEHVNIHISASVDDARSLCEHPISQKVLDLLDNRLSRQDC